MTRSSGRMPIHHAEKYRLHVSGLLCRGGIVTISRLMSPLYSFINTSLIFSMCHARRYLPPLIVTAKSTGERLHVSCFFASSTTLATGMCWCLDAYHLRWYVDRLHLLQNLQCL